MRYGQNRGGTHEGNISKVGVTESKITKQGGAGLLNPKPVPVSHSRPYNLTGEPVC